MVPFMKYVVNKYFVNEQLLSYISHLLNNPDFFKSSVISGEIVLSLLLGFFNKYAGIYFTYYSISADRIKHSSFQMIYDLN